MSLAFVFPGQGSQSVGMLDALAASRGEVEQTFAEASRALDLDLWRLVREGPEEALARTWNTQPAMLAAGVATWRAWRAAGGPAPAWLAGHSLGEYSALVCSGALDFGEAVRLVADRGRFMQEAVPPGTGAMAAVIGLDDEAVAAACRSAAQAGDGDEVVAPANLNAPGQVVIAGHAGAVARAGEAAAAAGARRVVELPVSVPSHCALMAPAAERLAGRLAEVDLGAPAIPVLHNADVSSHADADAIRAALVRQLSQPVRWVATVRRLAAEGAELTVECGPGRVLTGLGRRIERTLAATCVQDPASLEEALARAGAGR